MSLPPTGGFDSEPRLPSQPPARRPLSQQLVRNVAFSVVRKLVSGPIFLLLVPFILHRVGTLGYGVWSVLGTIIGLGWVLDMGLGNSVMKFVAEYTGKKDTLQLRRLLDTALAIYLLIAAAAVAALVLLARPIIGELFRGPQAPSAGEILPLWALLLPIVGLDLLGKPFLAALNGFQRLDLVNVILFCSAATNASLTVVFLSLGFKVPGLLWATLLGIVVALVLSAATALHLLPCGIPNPFRFHLRTAKRLCTFSLAVFSGAIMSTLQGQIEKLYLARLVGVVPVGWYGMAYDAATKVRRVPDLLLTPVMPAASELDASNERRKVAQLYFRAHKYTAVAIIPLVAFALVDSRILMSVWLGPKLSFIAVPFALLTIGSLYYQMASPIFAVLTGRGILRPTVITTIVVTVSNLILSFIFILRWGLIGAACGAVLPIVIGNTYYFWTTGKYLEIRFLAVLRSAYLKPALSALAACVAASAINLLVTNLWIELLAGLAAFAIVYFGALILLRFFDEFDWSKLETHLPLARHARKFVQIPYGARNV